MRCPRCEGLMVPDRFLDVLVDFGDLWFWGWRCVACGEIVDPAILVNRRPRPARMRSVRLHRDITLVGAEPA